MEEKKTIFDYIRQLFSIFGIIVILHVVLDLLVGDKACEVSTLFSLGSAGLSNHTLIQLFFLALICTLAQNIFLTDTLIKNMPLPVRNILFFATMLISSIIFIILFGWFPVGQFITWLAFILCFCFCTVFSVVISRFEERAEDRKMQEALNKLKK